MTGVTLEEHLAEVGGPPLACELVPRSAWWTNVRSNVSRADWEKCKAYSKTKTPGTCIICGGVGDRYATEAHEIWRYDDEYIVKRGQVHTGLQTLVDIWPLCTLCHRVKHLGRTRETSGPQAWARVIEHMQRVNQMSDNVLEQYIALQFQIWEIRSTMKWELDLSFLKEVGLDPGIGFDAMRKAAKS